MSDLLPTSSPGIPHVSVRVYGCLRDGRIVREYTLHSGSGLSLSVINLGGIVTALHAPDRLGRSANIVLGLGSLSEYEGNQAHLGSLVGRCANRIAGGQFVIDNRTYQIDANDGSHSLHGGSMGFGRRFWDIAVPPKGEDGKVAIDLSLHSPDGDQGYPGSLDVRVRYQLSPDNCWRIDYGAQTDQPTLVNLTSHCYFNLAGAGSALDHELMLNANRYAPVDVGLIPTGRNDVTGTVFDFRTPSVLRDRLTEGLAREAQFAFTSGFDHHYDLNRSDPDGHCLVARLSDPSSGRAMDVLSTEPGVQFYSGNFLDGSLHGVHGSPLRAGDGLCLETQQAPNAINALPQKYPQTHPSTVLRPGHHYSSSTIHRFSWR